MFNSQILLAQQSVNTTRTLETPLLANRLFAIVIDNRTHQFIGFLGAAVVIFVMYYWCVHACKNLKNGGARPKAKELLTMLLLIVFLVADSQNLAYLSKNTVNNFDVSSNKVVKVDGVQSPMIQAARNRPIQSDLSTQFMLNNPRIKQIMNQYLISF